MLEDMNKDLENVNALSKLGATITNNKTPSKEELYEQIANVRIALREIEKKYGLSHTIVRKSVSNKLLRLKDVANKINSN